jgi:hypothetical protein|tara:strand:+ start:155 stop:334 length:180 start_codon:yes stop_codon:yes gene_type:complete
MTMTYISDLEDLMYEAHHKGIKDECLSLVSKIKERKDCYYLEFGQLFRMAMDEIEKRNE